MCSLIFPPFHDFFLSTKQFWLSLSNLFLRKIKLTFIWDIYTIQMGRKREKAYWQAAKTLFLQDASLGNLSIKAFNKATSLGHSMWIQHFLIYVSLYLINISNDNTLSIKKNWIRNEKDIIYSLSFDDTTYWRRARGVCLYFDHWNFPWYQYNFDKSPRCQIVISPWSESLHSQPTQLQVQGCCYWYHGQCHQSLFHHS